MVKKNISIKNQKGVKKSLQDFIADEEGYVSKETILKIGLGTVAGLGMLGAMANAGHTNHAHHSNLVDYPMNSVITNCPVFNPTHANTPGHTSHSSY